jgi:hypothetical protein
MHLKSPVPSAVVILLVFTVAGCGPGQAPGPCDYNTRKVGCVGLLNFYSKTPAVNGTLVPLPGPAEGGIAPGIATLIVPQTSVGSSNSFEASVGGQSLGTVTCKVTSDAWLDINPSVVVQMTGLVTCGDW